MQRILYPIFCIICIVFSAQASSTKIHPQSKITLVDAIQRYERILERAQIFIQDAIEAEDADFLKDAQKKLVQAKELWGLIAKKVQQKIPDEEWAPFVIYSAQNLNGIGLDKLLQVLHDKREVLKAQFKKLEKELAANQENVKPAEQIVVMYPEKKQKCPEKKIRCVLIQKCV